MKKMFVISLLLVTATELPAQKWLRNLGKTLDKVEEVTNRLTGNLTAQEAITSSKVTTFKYGDVQISTTLPNFTIGLNKVKRISRECGTISLTFTNTSSEDVRLYGLNNMKSLTDSKGNDYTGYGKWKVIIGDQTIKRYGTDDDYTFPAGQPVNVVWYIYGLPGTATVKTEKVGSFMKTTTSMPSVTIQAFSMEPNIVYRQENLRRHFTLGISGLKIPAYTNIERKGIDREADGNEMPDLPTVENNGVIKSTAGDSTEKVIPICTYPMDDTPNGDGQKNRNDQKNGNSTFTTTVVGESSEKVIPICAYPSHKDSNNGKDSLDNNPPPKDEWRDRIQFVLDRQVSHLELRSDVHYTNEPRGDWRDGLRLTAISLSSAEYERFDGILFEYVDPELQFKTSKERYIAEYNSSYPRKGTRCGIITIVASEYKKGMTTRKRDGIPYYVFQTNTLTLEKIEATDTKEVDGAKMKVFIISVTDSPTAFGLAYDRAIMNKQTRKTEHILLGIYFIYNKNTGKWEANKGTRYNPKTQKWEIWTLV